MTQTIITIIGMGPRGLSILERLAHFSLVSGQRNAIRVEIVDPGECGQGTHYDAQPQHLLTNTLASQVTIFPPDSVTSGANSPSFLEWAHQNGYRHFKGSFHQTGAPHGDAIDEQHYLPRYLLGRYFSAAFDLVVSALPSHVSVCHRRRAARDVSTGADGRLTVHLDGGASFHTDYLVLTTGHGKRKPDSADLEYSAFVDEFASANDKLNYFSAAYPVEQFGRISPDATVAIQGAGLTAHDVISHLTVGRGGRFIEHGGQMRYEASGREPKLLLFSRSGLPFSARAVNQKGASGRYMPAFFTMDAIEALRDRALATRGDPRIDFVNEVMPLVMGDMARARDTALSGATEPAADFRFDEQARVAIEAILDPVGSRRFSSLVEFRGFLRDFLVDDLAEVDKGNVKSPVKAATDVLRDVREQFRRAAEYRGFTPESNAAFLAFANTLNRIVFGPPRHRNRELLALLDQGVVGLAGGPGASVRTDSDHACFAIESSFGGGLERRNADVLIASRIDAFSPETDRSELVVNLVSRGLIRAYRNGAYHPGGIDISADNHVIGRDGTANPRLWAVGYPVEGPHYYTQELPRPGRKSRLTIDAEVCMKGFFRSIGVTGLDDADAPEAVATHAVPFPIGG